MCSDLHVTLLMLESCCTLWLAVYLTGKARFFLESLDFAEFPGGRVLEKDKTRQGFFQITFAVGASASRRTQTIILHLYSIKGYSATIADTVREEREREDQGLSEIWRIAHRSGIVDKQQYSTQGYISKQVEDRMAESPIASTSAQLQQQPQQPHRFEYGGQQQGGSASTQTYLQGSSAQYGTSNEASVNRPASSSSSAFPNQRHPGSATGTAPPHPPQPVRQSSSSNVNAGPSGYPGYAAQSNQQQQHLQPLRSPTGYGAMSVDPDTSRQPQQQQQQQYQGQGSYGQTSQVS